MGVPAHDSRDFEFAKKFSLPIVQVISYANTDINEAVRSGERASEEAGDLVNSDTFNGLSSSQEGKEQIKQWLIKEGVSEEQTNYHLRDWLISRQRYWGAPIPMIHCEHCAKNEDGYLQKHQGTIHKNHDDWQSAGWYPVDESELPVTLPDISDYKPRGEGTGPLADHPEFYDVSCPACGKTARRETDVMDTFMDSSWYFLRYPSTDSKTASSKPFDPEVTKKWLPVHFYLGGAEHAVLHLMYARFVTHVLFDLKHISFEEPFPKFFANGLMIKDGAKMSKSKGNVVNPDSYIEKFGADTLRLYLTFMGPMDGSPDFRDTGIEGMERFTKRVWELLNLPVKEGGKTLESVMHKTIKRVTEEVKEFRYNTAIAAIMEYVNALKQNEAEISKENTVVLCQLLAPFTPHLTEEVWCEVFKKEDSIHVSTWPTYEDNKIIAEQIVVAVQVNGKLRGQVEISKEEIADEEKVVSKAKEDVQISKWLTNTDIKKTIYVKGKILNFVI
jgi:leucyl-tRNA synthetase